MSRSRAYTSKLIFFNTWMVCNIILIIIKPHELTTEISKCYTNLILSSFLYMILLAILYIRKEFDVFEPYLYISILHIFLYLISPLRSILVGEILQSSGVYTFNGCIKGTWIAFAVFLVISIFYHSNIKVSANDTELRFDKEKIIIVSNILWLIGFLSTLVYLSLGGMSVVYIVSLGNSGKFNNDMIGNNSYLFFSVIANVMFASWLFRFYYKPRRIVTWIMFFLTMTSLVVRGFRIFIVILCLSAFTVKYMSSNKRPSMKMIALVLVLGLLMIGVVGYSRAALRTNQDISFKDFGLDQISYAFWGNFDVYKVYYGVVNVVPEQVNYTYGSQMIWYTLIIFIPRALWPGKPYPPGARIVVAALSEYANRAGATYPALGEWYHEFGISGCLFFAAITGLLLKKLWNIGKKNSIDQIVLFSTIYAAMIQLVIRGYTPSNFWLIVSLCIPVFVIRALCTDRGMNNE